MNRIAETATEKALFAGFILTLAVTMMGIVYLVLGAIGTGVETVGGPQMETPPLIMLVGGWVTFLTGYIGLSKVKPAYDKSRT
jgi:hypothetical protein